MAIQDVPVDRFHPCPVCHCDCEYTLLSIRTAQKTRWAGEVAGVDEALASLDGVPALVLAGG